MYNTHHLRTVRIEHSAFAGNITVEATHMTLFSRTMQLGDDADVTTVIVPFLL